MIRRPAPSLICVGISASLSGRFAQFGRQALTGARTWVADANRRGGVRLAADARPVPLTLRYYDDGSQPAAAARSTRRLLAADDVHLLFGPYSSSLTSAAAEVAAEFARPLWNHGGAADDLYERGNEWIIGVLSPASRYFVGMLNIARVALPTAARLALVGVDGSVFAAAVLKGAERLARSVGFDVVLRGDHGPRGGGPDALAAQLRDCQADLILIAGSFEQDVRLAETLATSGPRDAIIGLVAAGVQAFGTRMGDAATGFYGPSQWEPSAAPRMDIGPAPAAARLRAALDGPVDYPAGAGLRRRADCATVRGTSWHS